MLTYEPAEDPTVEPAPEDLDVEDEVDELTRAFRSALDRDRT